MNNGQDNTLTLMNAVIGLLATFITYANAQENQTALGNALLPNNDDTNSEEKTKEVRLILLITGSVGFILIFTFLCYQAQICACHDSNISYPELLRARLAQRGAGFNIQTDSPILTTARLSSATVGIPIPDESNQESDQPPPIGYTGSL